MDNSKNLAKHNGFIIVGLSGCTNSGKTTITNRLKKRFNNSISINQDLFFREEDDPNHIWVQLDENLRHQNWEALTAVNWDKMRQELEKILNKPTISNRPTIVILEGHIIFNCKTIANLFNKKYFIKISDKELVYQRRIKRSYIPADPPGFFDKCVWPMYLQNLEELQNEKDIIYINGLLDIEAICRFIINDLENTFPILKN